MNQLSSTAFEFEFRATSEHPSSRKIRDLTHLLAELPVPREGRALRLLELVGEQDLEEVLVLLRVDLGT